MKILNKIIFLVLPMVLLLAVLPHNSYAQSDLTKTISLQKDPVALAKWRNSGAGLGSEIIYHDVVKLTTPIDYAVTPSEDERLGSVYTVRPNTDTHDSEATFPVDNKHYYFLALAKGINQVEYQVFEVLKKYADSIQQGTDLIKIKNQVESTIGGQIIYKAKIVAQVDRVSDFTFEDHRVNDGVLVVPQVDRSHRERVELTLDKTSAVFGQKVTATVTFKNYSEAQIEELNDLGPRIWVFGKEDKMESYIPFNIKQDANGVFKGIAAFYLNIPQAQSSDSGGVEGAKGRTVHFGVNAVVTDEENNRFKILADTKSIDAMLLSFSVDPKTVTPGESMLVTIKSPYNFDTADLRVYITGHKKANGLTLYLDGVPLKYNVNSRLYEHFEYLDGANLSYFLKRSMPRNKTGKNNTADFVIELGKRGETGRLATDTFSYKDESGIASCSSVKLGEGGKRNLGLLFIIFKKDAPTDYFPTKQSAINDIKSWVDKLTLQEPFKGLENRINTYMVYDGSQSSYIAPEHLDDLSVFGSSIKNTCSGKVDQVIFLSSLNIPNFHKRFWL
ncbi:MAG: hypothetical protein WC797_02090 [Candidatus Paceibacterota bacterium]|jgi:hypothetical protein